MSTAFGGTLIALLLIGFVLFFIVYGWNQGSDNAEAAKTSIEIQREVIGGPSSGRPYSPAVLVTRTSITGEERTIIGRTLYVSGQVAIDPDSGVEVRDSIEAETRQALSNIKRWVEEAGFSLADATKCTVFLADMADYGAMNSAYIEFFPADPPARECVAVKEIVRGFRVEISLTAER